MTENKKTDYRIELMLKAVDIQKQGTELMKLGKDNLRDIIIPLAYFLQPYAVSATKGSSPDIAHMMSQISNIKYFNKLLKEQLAQLYISFGTDLKNIYAVARCDSRLEEAWKLILNSPEISSVDIEDVLKRKLNVVSTPYWGTSYFCELIFSPLIVLEIDRYRYSFSGNRDNKYKFTLLTDSREKLVKAFFGEKALEPIVMEKLPEGKDLIIENFEKCISSDLSFLSGIAMTDSVLSSTGAVTAAKIKSLKKTFKTLEFQTVTNEWSIDRIEMLVNAFFLFDTYGGKYGEKVDTKNPAKFAKFIVDTLPLCLSSTKFGAFLPAFKGFTKTWTDSSNAGTITKIIGKLLSTAADGWLSLENLRLRYLCTGSSGSSSYTHLFSLESISRHTLKRKSDNLDTYDMRSKGIDWVNEVDFPFVVHWIRFLCGAGLLEIAEEKNSGELKDDMLEGIRYVRLTPLGRYAYGFDNKYTPIKATISTEFEIDDSNCIITVLSDNCPYTLFLQQISVAISTNRFHITPESLLKNCDSYHKVYDRLDNLEAIIDVEKSPGLKAVIDEVDKRVKCAEYLPDDYVILKLRPDLPGLVKIITTNKDIRSNVILAEQGILLVKRSFLYRLKNICSNNGYLLD
ncbi:MAG: hypothetical protein HDR88_07570 [Bacteroides sp.]|nr:hypothetical protein [Bacteroides sp.]